MLLVTKELRSRSSSQTLRLQVSHSSSFRRSLIQLFCLSLPLRVLRLHRTSARTSDDASGTNDAATDANDVSASWKSDAHDAAAVPVIESAPRDTSAAGFALQSARNYKSYEFPILNCKKCCDRHEERRFRLTDDVSCP